MKINSLLTDEVADLVRDLALTKGLEKINYEKPYTLSKIGSKDKNGAFIVHEKHTILKNCKLSLIGTSTFVCIYFTSPHNYMSTSKVISCTKKKSCYIIETENSFYELKECK